MERMVLEMIDDVVAGTQISDEEIRASRGLVGYTLCWPEETAIRNNALWSLQARRVALDAASVSTPRPQYGPLPRRCARCGGDQPQTTLRGRGICDDCA